MDSPTRKQKLARTAVLLAAGIAYLIFVVLATVMHADLAQDKTMQYAIHTAIIVTVFAYLFFVEMIYRTENDKASARLALIFAALFILPVLLGRAIGIYAISFPEADAAGYFNFYGTLSISRATEITGWTTLFPVSMLFLAKIFLKDRKFLGILCLLSAACCFAALGTLVYSAALFFWIGLMGWGVLFLLIVIVYIRGTFKV